MEPEIRELIPNDWPEVRSIYLAGIATGHATFETESPTWQRWDGAHLSRPRLVVVLNERIVGWAALSHVSRRDVYAGVAEVSVYVDEGTRGQGIGKLLLETLVRKSEEQGVWTLQASIFPENVASVSLHRACGFSEVGTRERIGQLKGAWRDTVLLERRSKVVE